MTGVGRELLPALYMQQQQTTAGSFFLKKK
jgi:hypothetical protein